MANLKVDGVAVKNFSTGIYVTDNAFLLTATDVLTAQNSHYGWDIETTSVGGTPSQIRFYNCISLYNYVGFQVGPVQGSDFEFHGVTSSNNTYGLVADTASQVFGGSYEGNITTGIWLRAQGSVVVGAAIPQNQVYGIVVDASNVLISGVQKSLNPDGDIYVNSGQGSMLLQIDPAATVGQSSGASYVQLGGNSLAGSPLTTNPAGFLSITVSGVTHKVPYY